MVVLTAAAFIKSISACECKEKEGIALSIDNEIQDNKFESLEALQDLFSERNLSIEICINVLELNLTKNVTFLNHSRLMITSCSDATVINCNTTDAGIIFEDILKLEMRNLIFVSCGAAIAVRRNSLLDYRSAVTLLQCGQIELANFTVRKSRGIGLTVLRHRGGSITITSSEFEENTVEKYPGLLGGGGVYIGDFYMDDVTSTIDIINCTFKNNWAHTRHYKHIFTDVVGRDVEGYGRGGGLLLAFEQNIQSTEVTATISDCTFIGNMAFIGSGLSVKIGEASEQSIKVLVRNTTFEKNGCSIDKNMGLGGGMHLSFNSYDSSIISSNITIENVKFEENCAKHGGGVFIYSHKQDSNASTNTLLFDDCIFKNNSALTGSALDTSPNIFKRLRSGYTIVPTFRNCTFLDNRVIVNTDIYGPRTQRNPGIGTIYSSLCDLAFEGFTCFKNNHGTAIHIVNGNIDLSGGSARFERNTGIEGGALALIGISSFIVGPNNTYEFVNNRALHRGGAVFVHLIGNHDFSLSRSCFIQYKDDSEESVPLLARYWYTNITFRNNNANFGNSIYTTSVFPCQVINNGSEHRPFYVTVNVADAFRSWGISFDDERTEVSDNIATDGSELLENHTSTSLHLDFFPGFYLDHNIRVLDDLKTEVSEPLRASVRKNDSQNIRLDETSSSFVKKSIRLLGQPGSRAELSLQTVSSRMSYITLPVELLECPPGFSIQDDRCTCDQLSYSGLLGCNYTGGYSYLVPGFWAGMVRDENVPNNTLLTTSTCPLGYCYAQSTSGKIELPQNRDDLEKVICGNNNRQGVLCGDCVKNYTVFFHSLDSQCQSEHRCHLGWLFYIISEIIPVTIVFVVILVFDISFTSGAVNGFVLFCQMLASMNINASGVIQFPESINTAIEIYTSIYGLLNLEFFQGNSTSFCLWRGASTLDVIAFKYVTIVYALLLVLCLIWFMNKCGGKSLGKWCRITKIKTSVIHGISAFLIICYSQVIKTSLFLLNGHDLALRQSHNNFNVSKRVWLNGNLRYFRGKHLLYALPALLCLFVIGVLPPVFLLIYPTINKVLDVLKIGDSKAADFLFRWIIPINTFKPLLDSFQGCFKDNMRFFAGFYFLYRWIALVAYTASSDFAVAYVTTQACLTFILVIHAVCQPYISRVHNIIDTLLLADLLCINFLTYGHYIQFLNEEYKQVFTQELKVTTDLQMVLIFTPFVVFVVYIIRLILNRVSSWCAAYKDSNINQMRAVGIALKPLKVVARSICSGPKFAESDDSNIPHRLIDDFDNEEGRLTSGFYTDVDRST